MRKFFWSGVNSARTRSFPGADTGSDHDLLMMTFNFAWKESASQKNQQAKTGLKIDLEKLKDPNVLETFQAMIGRKFAPLTIMSNEHTDIDLMITTFNTAVTETASEILGKPYKKKKNPGSMQKFLICVTKGKNWERKDQNLKDLRNTRKWTTTARGAWKRQKKLVS